MGLKVASIFPRRTAWKVFCVLLAMLMMSYLSPVLFPTSGACGEGQNRPCRLSFGTQPQPSRAEFSGTALRRNANRDKRDKPYSDLVVAAFVLGGDSIEALAEMERVRRVYARYRGLVSPDGGSAGGYQTPLSLRYILVVGAQEVEKGIEVPDEGILVGDIFYVDVPAGYRFLSHKTKALMALSEHLSFRFLAKTDGDTFPCLGRVTQQLIEMPVAQQPRAYAGLLAPCGKIFPPGHPLHDPEFLKATGGVLPCHPMYHQGAFYVLGEDIVRYLYENRELLKIMSVEDAMVGIWLLGIDKVILDIGGQFYCECFTAPVPRGRASKQSFYHFCKTDEKIDGCLRKFGTC